MSGPALLEKVSGGSEVGWVIVPQLVGCRWGGWEFGLLLLGFSKALKILFGVMLNSSFQWLLIENSL